VNWVDFVIIGIIAISAIVSFFRGFLREALSLLIWVIAIWMAVMFYPGVEPMIPQDWGLPATVRMALAGAAILLGVLIAGGIVTWALGSFLDKTGMSGTDRVVGVFFGGLRGIILVAIAIIIVGLVPAIADNSYWKQSKLVPHFQPLADWGKQMWDNSGMQRKLNGYIDGIAGEKGGAIIDLSPQDAAKPGETVKPQDGIELPLTPEKPAEQPATDTTTTTTTVPVTEPATPATGN
jgi:membrane protein required for colicin V production